MSGIKLIVSSTFLFLAHLLIDLLVDVKEADLVHGGELCDQIDDGGQ